MSQFNIDEFSYSKICEQKPEVEDNTMLISFLENFIVHLEEEISKMIASYGELASVNKKLHKNKNKHLEKIFANVWYGDFGDCFAKHLTEMAREARAKLQAGPQQISEVLENFRTDYEKWTESLEKHAEVNLTVDHVTHLFYHEVEAELGKLTAEAETVESQLKAIKSEESIRMVELESAIQELQEECELFDKLTEENSEARIMQPNKFIERQNENYNFMVKINELNAEVEALEAKWDHYN